MISTLIHFSSIAVTVAINSIGSGISQGIVNREALSAINTQPQAKHDIIRTAIFGTALIETAAIMSFIIAILLFAQGTTQNLAPSIAEIGIALALSLSGLCVAYASSFPASASCHAIARQPFFSDKILRFMLITQSIIQTPIIFSFIVAMFIKGQSTGITHIAQALTLLASGACIGIGSIGPALGLGSFAEQACKGLGINRDAYNKLVPFTFISQAIIETPMIFALLVSLIMLVTPSDISILKGIACICAAMCMGMGTVGPGVASGKTAAYASHQIALNPELHGSISKVSMFAQGLIDTCAVYTFLVAVILILLI